MADRIALDASELHALSVDLGKAAARMFPETVKVLEHAAANVKDEMRADAEQSQTLGQIGRTIDYSREDRYGQIGFEVGPNRERGAAAGLAGAYLGWPDGGGATLSMDAPLEHEAPRLEKALGDLLGDLL